jgi:hypothetical protein
VPTQHTSASQRPPQEFGEEEESEDERVKDPAKFTGPSMKQEAAYREAMDRYLTEMEIRASEAIADRRQWEEHLDHCLNQERGDQQRWVLAVAGGCCLCSYFASGPFRSRSRFRGFNCMWRKRLQSPVYRPPPGFVKLSPRILG